MHRHIVQASFDCSPDPSGSYMWQMYHSKHKGVITIHHGSGMQYVSFAVRACFSCGELFVDLKVVHDLPEGFSGLKWPNTSWLHHTWRAKTSIAVRALYSTSNNALMSNSVTAFQWVTQDETVISSCVEVCFYESEGPTDYLNDSSKQWDKKWSSIFLFYSRRLRLLFHAITFWMSSAQWRHADTWLQFFVLKI